MKAFLAACLGVFFLAGAAQAAGDARDALVVDTAWLAAHVDDPDLVLLHVGDPGDYEDGHIGDARLVSLDDVSVSEHTRDGLMLQMPDDEELRRRLQKLGISDDSRIVVYYAGDWVSPATRVVFTLQHAGLGDRTRLLDGGLSAWVRSGGALSTSTPAPRQGTLSKLATQGLVVDADFVKANLATPGIAIVDGRAAAFYDGVQTGGAHGQVHKTGHVAGARSIPFTELTDEQLLLRSQDELRALFERAGVKPGDTVVGYCHIGQQATAMLFAARLLGHPVKLYDGSFQDWSRGEDRPVEAAAVTAQQ